MSDEADAAADAAEDALDGAGAGLPVSLPVVPTSSTIRPFTVGAISAGIDKALSELPKDAKGAIVAYADLQGGHLAVAARIDDHWSFAGHLDKPWKEDFEASAEVRFQW